MVYIYNEVHIFKSTVLVCSKMNKRFHWYRLL